VKWTGASLAVLPSILAIGALGCGGGNDEIAGSGTSEEAGGAAEKYVDGACVKTGASSAIPKAVDCDDPAATGVLRETDDYNKCEGLGFNLLTVGGEDINKQFCVDPAS
jgi:hypothetical protein